MVRSKVSYPKNIAKIEYLAAVPALKRVRQKCVFYFQIYTHRDSHHASHPIQLSKTSTERTIQRRPSKLGVPPRPRYKFTRRLRSPSCKVDRGPNRMEPRLRLSHSQKKPVLLMPCRGPSFTGGTVLYQHRRQTGCARTLRSPTNLSFTCRATVVLVSSELALGEPLDTRFAISGGP